MKNERGYYQTDETPEADLSGIPLILALAGVITVYGTFVIFMSNALANITFTAALKLNVSELWADRLGWSVITLNIANSIRILMKMFKIANQEKTLRKRVERRERFWNRVYAMYGEEAKEMYKHVNF